MTRQHWTLDTLGVHGQFASKPAACIFRVKAGLGNLGTVKDQRELTLILQINSRTASVPTSVNRWASRWYTSVRHNYQAIT